MILDFLSLSLRHIKRTSIRAWITIIGIVIGVVAVVSLISLSEGLKHTIMSQFEDLGKSGVMITAGKSEFSSNPLSSALVDVRFSKKELDAISKIDGVDFATGLIIKDGEVKFGSKKVRLRIVGISTNKKIFEAVRSVQFIKIEEGRFFNENERKVAIVGYLVANKIFPNLNINDKIQINGIKFKVIGILKKSGVPVSDSVIRIPSEDAKEVFNEKGFSTIFVKVLDNYDVERVSENIKRTLRRIRKVKENEEDFTVKTSKEVIDKFNLLFSIVQWIVIGIAGISLVVSAIGIMNIMFTLVTERTKEIGIMKAIGARNSDILLIFLLESGILGVIGGAIGLALGITLGYSVQYIANTLGYEKIKVKFSLMLILGSLSFSFLIGMLSGLLPALKASKLQPSETLRYE